MQTSKRSQKKLNGIKNHQQGKFDFSIYRYNAKLLWTKHLKKQKKYPEMSEETWVIIYHYASTTEIPMDENCLRGQKVVIVTRRTWNRP